MYVIIDINMQYPFIDTIDILLLPNTTLRYFFSIIYWGYFIVISFSGLLDHMSGTFKTLRNAVFVDGALCILLNYCKYMIIINISIKCSLTPTSRRWFSSFVVHILRFSMECAIIVSNIIIMGDKNTWLFNTSYFIKRTLV